jgi:hypothetical protein
VADHIQENLSGITDQLALKSNGDGTKIREYLQAHFPFYTTAPPGATAYEVVPGATMYEVV